MPGIPTKATSHQPVYVGITKPKPKPKPKDGNSSTENTIADKNKQDRNNNALSDNLQGGKNKKLEAFTAPDPAKNELSKTKKLIDEARLGKTSQIESIELDFSEIKLTNEQIFEELKRHTDLFADISRSIGIIWPNDIKENEAQRFLGFIKCLNKHFKFSELRFPDSDADGEIHKDAEYSKRFNNQAYYDDKVKLNIYDPGVELKKIRRSTVPVPIRIMAKKIATFPVPVPVPIRKKAKKIATLPFPFPFPFPFPVPIRKKAKKIATLPFPVPVPIRKKAKKIATLPFPVPVPIRKKAKKIATLPLPFQIIKIAQQFATVRAVSPVDYG